MAQGRNASANGVAKCKYPECQEPGNFARGNCRKHYNLHNALVNAGVTSWATLIRQGKALKGWIRRKPQHQEK
jgi:hypothetical protein